MKCCGDNNNKKAKDWGNSESSPKNRINIPLIVIGLALLGVIIYKFVI